MKGMGVCVYVLYRNPNHWKDLDEIWKRGGPQGWELSVGDWTGTSDPAGMGCIKGVWGAYGASRLQFVQKLYKTNMAGHPQYSQVGHLFGPHGHSLWRGVNKIKVIVYVPSSYFVGLETPYPDPVVQGVPKGDLLLFLSLGRAFWQTLYQTKVAGHPQLSENGLLFWIPNPDLEGPGPSVPLEPWCLILK